MTPEYIQECEQMCHYAWVNGIGLVGLLGWLGDEITYLILKGASLLKYITCYTAN